MNSESIDITSDEKQQFLKQLEFLNWSCDNAESLSNESVIEIIDLFPHLVDFLPIIISNLNNPDYTLERITVNELVKQENRRLSSLTELRYPPRQIAASMPYNRASLEGQIVFYAGNMGILPITIETKPTVGQLFTKSKWKLLNGKSLNILVICQSDSLVRANPIELGPDFNNYMDALSKLRPHIKEVVKSAYDLIVKAFTKEVNPINRRGYLLSALFSDYVFNKGGYNIDAIMYPSVPNSGAAMNFAIKPDVLDSAFTMVQADEAILLESPDSTSNMWSCYGTGKCISYDSTSLELEWENLPLAKNDPAVELIWKYQAKFN